jgi:hypothetical protein
MMHRPRNSLGAPSGDIFAGERAFYDQVSGGADLALLGLGAFFLWLIYRWPGRRK